jgi:hypothetical protein
MSLDQQTIRRAKILAARQATSIRGLAGRQIGVPSEEGPAYDRSERQAAPRLDKGFHLGGAVRVDGHEIHER